MSVVNTSKWLREYIRERKKVTSQQYFELQRRLICEPIADYFEEFNDVQLHQYFLENGMFYPDAKILNELRVMEKNNIWKMLQSYYEMLRKEWSGEEANIFVFPIEKRNKLLMKELNGKMGISFHDVILLFITKDLSHKEIKALFTHEYNHVCRLAEQQKDFDELTLLDSMIIEGMAEVAVEKTIGEELLAPWVSLYSKEELFPYWHRIVDFLQVKGKEKHDPILYGDPSSRRGRFPKWFGYCLGYQIVSSYVKNNQGMKVKQLLSIDSKEILAKSDFALK
ncbi:hypothetical protein BKP35_13570 [Anaerobacillus arseniciselenatis]|uniref:DUF2268 domain-containing protein n=1 Tax=Anaerobacillus arseniciselenatis TaxID=85682 RepID=A0A1S2LCB2_9BACI|nr:DUF2268 domain-containing putative Zn-dependent protease [Anaerobacillus arseniciselenatis]OIJ10138.1 hypothetical protein BKP35_13570 [Anaerobacillus arseniciselenatis]